MFCVNCGANVADDSKFCPNCGAAIDNAPAAAPVEETGATTVLTPDMIEEFPAAPVAEEPTLEPVYTAAPVVEEPAYVPTPEPTPVAAYVPPQPTYVPPQPVYTAPQPTYVAPAPVYTAPYAPTPVVDAIPDTPLTKHKRVGGSTVVLVATILYSLVLLMQIITAFRPNPITELFYMMRAMGEEVPVELFSTFSILPFFSLIGMTPMILLAVGTWMNYVGSKKLGSTSTAGLTMVKISMILRLVSKFLVVALGLLMLVLSGVLVSALEDYYYEASVTVLPIVLYAVILMATMVLPIIYDFSVIAAVNSMKKTITTGVAHSDGYGRLAVLNYVMAALSALGLLFSLIMSSLYTSILSAAMYEVPYQARSAIMSVIGGMFGVHWSSVVGTLAWIAAMVLFSISLSNYKKNAEA